MPLEPDHIAHELRTRADAWADADAAYRALDDTTKTVLAEVIVDYLGNAKSNAEAESRARASKPYKDHLAALAAARRAANRARVAYDTYRAWIELVRSREATARAEMGL